MNGRFLPNLPLVLSTMKPMNGSVTRPTYASSWSGRKRPHANADPAHQVVGSVVHHHQINVGCGVIQRVAAIRHRGTRWMPLCYSPYHRTYPADFWFLSFHSLLCSHRNILRFLHGAYSCHCVPARPELYVYIMNVFLYIC